MFSNAEANAHLIAAAPDLLAVCKRAIEHLEDSAHSADIDMVAELQAAIAKAKGL